MEKRITQEPKLPDLGRSILLIDAAVRAAEVAREASKVTYGEFYCNDSKGNQWVARASITSGGSRMEITFYPTADHDSRPRYSKFGKDYIITRMVVAVALDAHSWGWSRAEATIPGGWVSDNHMTQKASESYTEQESNIIKLATEFYKPHAETLKHIETLTQKTLPYLQDFEHVKRQYQKVQDTLKSAQARE